MPSRKRRMISVSCRQHFTFSASTRITNTDRTKAVLQSAHSLLVCLFLIRGVGARRS